MRLPLLLLTVAGGLSCSVLGCRPAGARVGSIEAQPQLPRGAAEGPTAARVAMLRRVPDRAGAPAVPHQAVRATVGGHETLLIVDTGAQGLVLTVALATTVGLAVQDTGINGRDWRGQPLKMSRTDHPSLIIEGLGPVVDRPSAVTEFSAGFVMRGLGGTLSPQWLATDTDDVVIDLRHARLLLRERTLPPEPPFGIALGADPEPVCLDRTGGIEARSLSIQVVVAGVPARLAIDTGADDTILFTSSKAARALSTLADGGASEGNDRRHAVPLRAGSWARSVDVRVAEGESNRACPFEGRLGLNVLRACVVTISQRDSAVRCDPES